MKDFDKRAAWSIDRLTEHGLGEEIISHNDLDTIIETIDFLRLHAGALEHQLSIVNLDGHVAMLSALNLAREFATGFHGMSRNNAENMAEELLEVLNAAIAKGSKGHE